MEAADREFFVQLVGSMSDLIYTLHFDHGVELQELRDRTDYLFLHLRGSLDPSFEEEWNKVSATAQKERQSNKAKFEGVGRRLEQMKLLLEGKSLREIDAIFKLQDERRDKRQQEIRRAFEKIGNS